MLKWDSVPGNIIEFVFNGMILPVLNDSIMKEYREVLARPKFHLTEDIIRDVLESIQKNGINVDAKAIDIDLLDPKDRVFYEVVMEEREAEDAYLITGNIKHFPVKPFVVTPRKMLDIILSDSEK